MSQAQLRKPEPAKADTDTPATDAAVKARKDAIDADVDDLLAEIDEALGSETEAQAFVEGYVQKGGQ